MEYEMKFYFTGLRDADGYRFLVEKGAGRSRTRTVEVVDVDATPGLGEALAIVVTAYLEAGERPDLTPELVLSEAPEAEDIISLRNVALYDAVVARDREIAAVVAARSPEETASIEAAVTTERRPSAAEIAEDAEYERRRASVYGPRPKRDAERRARIDGEYAAARALGEIEADVLRIVRDTLREGYPNVPLSKLELDLRLASIDASGIGVLKAAVRIFAVTSTVLAFVLSTTALGARVVPFPATLAPKPVPVYAPKPVPTPRPIAIKGDR